MSGAAKLESYYAKYDLDFYTNDKNIPDQGIVEETINYFKNGPGKRGFDVLPFFNLLWVQNEFIRKHKDDSNKVIAHLKNLPASEVQKHILYGFILKWHGGYPVNNLDEGFDATLKTICKEFLGYPEDSPEKTFCKASVATYKKFRTLESLLNTSIQTGIPADQIAKELQLYFPIAEKKFQRFRDLFDAAVDQGLIVAPESIQALAISIVQHNIEFESWLTEKYDWHPADRDKFSEYLTMDKFKKFIIDTKAFAVISKQVGATEEQTPSSQENNKHINMSDRTINLFVTYSWEGDEHNNQVISFTDHLRGMGYNAMIDRMISQNESAINFKKMMYQAFSQVDKVIIVLSEKYKQKAEKFEGGVGIEYEIIITDFPKNPRKYILVSFNGIKDEIIPFAFQGREIIDLKNSNGLEKLSYKIEDVDEIAFQPVNPVRKKVAPKDIAPFIKVTNSLPVAENTNKNIPWDANSVEKFLSSAIERNDVSEIKEVIKNNPFLLIELSSRKDFQQPVFRDINISATQTVDFVWLNDNSDGPEWVMVKIAEPQMAVMEGDVASYVLTRSIGIAQKWKNDLEASPEIGIKLFGAISRYRIIVVGGSMAAWASPEAIAWRASHNKQSAIEVRSSGVLQRSLDLLKSKPGEFWGCAKNPTTLPAEELTSYQQTYEYLKRMIRLFNANKG